MFQLLQWALWFVGLALQFLVLSSLIAGPLRKYFEVFIYSLILFITTVIEIIARWDLGTITRLWSFVFWACDFARLLGLYAVVISLVSHAVAGEEKRKSARRLLIVLSVMLWAGSFYMQYGTKLEFLIVNVSRNLSFCLALVNLALWFTLIAGERRDTTLLMITGGLGIQMTGEAIGQSLRQISRTTELVGTTMQILSHFLCLFIWWQAFSKEGKLLKQTASARPAAKAGVPESRIK
jgi:hypothetical protein